MNKTLNELIGYGLEGIEVINLRTPSKKNKLYYSLAKEYNITPTFGSDFHDYHTDDIGVYVPDEFLENSNKEKKIVKKYKKVCNNVI